MHGKSSGRETQHPDRYTHVAVLAVKSQAEPLVSRLLDLAKRLRLGLPRQASEHVVFEGGSKGTGRGCCRSAGGGEGVAAAGQGTPRLDGCSL